MNSSNEIWKDIKGYEGLYQVSNTGKVKHLKWRKPMCSNKGGLAFYVTMPEREVKLKPQYSKKGKLNAYNVHLSKRFIEKGKNKVIRTKRKVETRLIQSLVAEHFMKNKPRKNEKVKLIHIDGDKKNNHINNLKYVKHNQRIASRKDLY